MGIFDIFGGKNKKGNGAKNPPKHDSIYYKKNRGISDRPKGPPNADVSQNESSQNRGSRPPVRTYCGICGKEIKGKAFYRRDLGIQICRDCAPNYQNLSTHERVKECGHCGYKFLPGFSRWYFSSSDPKCIVCGKGFADGWTYERLLKMLSDTNIAQKDAQDAMAVIKYGRLGHESCPILQLSGLQKDQLYLKAIRLPHLCAHYEAFLALRRSENKTQEIQDAIQKYEKERDNPDTRKTDCLNQEPIQNNRKKTNSSNISDKSDTQKKQQMTYKPQFFVSSLPRKDKPPPRAPVMGVVKNDKPQNRPSSGDISNNFSAQKPGHSDWLRDLKMLPIDLRYKNCYFKESLAGAIPYIQKKIDAPSMSSTFLQLSKDGRAFIIGYTNTHRHEVRRTGTDEFAFTTERM